MTNATDSPIDAQAPTARPVGKLGQEKVMSANPRSSTTTRPDRACPNAWTYRAGQPFTQLMRLMSRRDVLASRWL